MPAGPAQAWVQALAPSEADEAALDRTRHPFADELAQVRAALRRRGSTVHAVHPADEAALWRRADLAEDFVFGDRHFMARAVAALGREAAVAGSYPRALAGLLGRAHRIGPAREVLAETSASVRPCFVKPSRPCFVDGHKLQAQVVPGPLQLDALPPELRERELIVAELVEWMSEYRCYVRHSRILGVHAYHLRLPEGWPPGQAEAIEDALPEMRPSLAWLQDAVQRLDAAGESVAGYCLDVGLIAFGAMALVEMNDGLALTNHGLADDDYLALHLARWRELMG